MSYDIYIGEAGLVVREGCDDPVDSHAVETRQIAAEVEHVELPDAPLFPFDSMTGRGNSRHPGYGQWAKFCSRVGLKSMVFDQATGLMRDHPGTVLLTAEHLARVRRALDAWRSTHPVLEPGWCGCSACLEDGDPDNEEPHVERDQDLARLIWLEWWMGWALKTCKTPAFHNR